jgi:hypothetical protein
MRESERESGRASETERELRACPATESDYAVENQSGVGGQRRESEQIRRESEQRIRADSKGRVDDLPQNHGGRASELTVAGDDEAVEVRELAHLDREHMQVVVFERDRLEEGEVACAARLLVRKISLLAWKGFITSLRRRPPCPPCFSARSQT